MTAIALNRIGYVAAIGTFLIATIILLGDFFGWKGDFAGAGFLFLAIAFIGNLAVLLTIVIIGEFKRRTGYLKGIYAMLLNLPVAILYIIIGSYLQGFYRLELNNDTDSTISQIELYGCSNHALETLHPGEQKVLWVEINGDCSLSMTYHDSTNKKHKVAVSGYLTTGMGTRDTYRISGKDNQFWQE